ncbi:hypothetical protein BRPE64_ACDS26750 [Caballeronia insecticola]|uniref:Right handed beta helix domain-containing protein n=1 Tax=Caballeronia insecticola TaxID=758793 RepID=R4WJ87_9BURK|nr:hypothetical protein BRPE64_ACDS26750 [Caballeronia insecticola]
MQIRYFRSLIFRDNHAQDLLGRALYLGACDPDVGATVRIERNAFERCSSTTVNKAYNSAIMIGVDAPSSINELVLRKNTALSCGSTLYAVSNGPLTIGALLDEENSIDRSMQRVGTIGAAARLAPGRIQIRRTDNAPPRGVVRASYGSEITDATTGIIWRCDQPGETVGSWTAVSR